MKENVPNKWVIFKCNNGSDYKVFGMWSGGYLDGDSWRANSCIKKVEEKDDHYLFHGFSGSIYWCHKEAYGVTAYGASILASQNIEYLTEEEFKNLDWECITQG